MENNELPTSTPISNPRQLVRAMQASSPQEEDAQNVEHRFWDTQPVPKMSERVAAEGPLEVKTIDDVRPDPLALPDAFEWCVCDVTNQEELKEIYTLLNENYVEDSDNIFRFDYAPGFLQWALTPPGFLPNWHIGVRGKEKKKKLVGFISGVPARVRVADAEVDVAEINFLCVHKKLRSKRLAPVLIREVTRRVNLTGRWQAIYTAGVLLPKPFAECQYHHRSLNIRKLVEVRFTQLGGHMTLARSERLNKLPDEPKHKLVPMEARHVPQVGEMLRQTLRKTLVHPVMEDDEIEHWLMGPWHVVKTYVIENEKGEATDMASFYSLPSTIMGHAQHDRLNAAFCYYQSANTLSLTELMADLLVCAKKEGFDVFNALDVAQNKEFLDTEKGLKFGVGDGYLRYYLFNWKIPPVKPHDVGLVLL